MSATNITCLQFFSPSVCVCSHRMQLKNYHSKSYQRHIYCIEKFQPEQATEPFAQNTYIYVKIVDFDEKCLTKRWRRHQVHCLIHLTSSMPLNLNDDFCFYGSGHWALNFSKYLTNFHSECILYYGGLKLENMLQNRHEKNSKRCAIGIYIQRREFYERNDEKKTRYNILYAIGHSYVW